MADRMKLGIIDYQLPRGGVERFVLGVLNALPADVDITLFSAWDALDGYRALTAQSARTVRLVERPVPVQQVALIANDQAALAGPRIFDVPADLWDGIDIAWFPWVNRHLIPRDRYAKTVATVHDLIAVELGEYMADKREPVGRAGHWFAMSMEDLLVRRLCGSLAKVVVDAGRTRNHLARAYGPLTRQPEVIYPSMEHVAAVSAEPVDQLGLPSRYLIYPASYSSHKNHETAFLALAKLKAEQPEAFLPLILTGGNTQAILTGADYRGAYLKALIAHLGLEIGRDLIVLGNVSEGQFRSVMGNARGLIFPTFAEGFGFPPLEAVYLGVPVAASDIEILRENLDRVGAPALWFRPDSVDQLAAAMARLSLEEESLRSAAAACAGRMIEGGWTDVGRQYVQAFRDQIAVASMVDSYAR